MSHQIASESYFLCISILTGIIITAVYDLLRILRRIIPHNSFFIAMEDFLFWFFAAVYVFLVLHETNNGTVRWFSIGGSALGMFFYKKTLGRYIVEFMSTIINQILHLVCEFFLLLFRPVKWLVSKLLRPVKKLGKFSKNRLTGNIKQVKIGLCKRKKRKQKEMSEG